MLLVQMEEQHHWERSQWEWIQFGSFGGRSQHLDRISAHRGEKERCHCPRLELFRFALATFDSLLKRTKALPSTCAPTKNPIMTSMATRACESAASPYGMRCCGRWWRLGTKGWRTGGAGSVFDGRLSCHCNNFCITKCHIFGAKNVVK